MTTLNELAQRAVGALKRSTNPWTDAGGTLANRNGCASKRHLLDRVDLQETMQKSGAPEPDLDEQLNVASVNLRQAVEEIKTLALTFSTERRSATARGHANVPLGLGMLHSPVAEGQAPPRMYEADHNRLSVVAMEVA